MYIPSLSSLLPIPHPIPLGGHRAPGWAPCVIQQFILAILGFPGGSVVKNPPANAEDMGSIPGLGRSPGEGNGNSFQYSCLGNLMDRGVWWTTVHGVAQSRARLSD